MSESEAGTRPDLAGWNLCPLDETACERFLAWLLGVPGVGSPTDTPELAGALAHGDHGVTWGRYDAMAQVWRLGSQVAPQVSPAICRETLQELRLFGASGEVLIWRTETGLRGRVLRDTDPAADAGDETNPLRPSCESRLLRGDSVVAPCAHGFTHVRDRKGAEQVLPLAVTAEQLKAGQVRLAVRHYYEQDAKSGAVRIAATRLVKVTGGSPHGA